MENRDKMDFPASQGSLAKLLSHRRDRNHHAESVPEVHGVPLAHADPKDLQAAQGGQDRGVTMETPGVRVPMAPADHQDPKDSLANQVPVASQGGMVYAVLRVTQVHGVRPVIGDHPDRRVLLVPMEIVVVQDSKVDQVPTVCGVTMASLVDRATLVSPVHPARTPSIARAPLVESSARIRNDGTTMVAVDAEPNSDVNKTYSKTCFLFLVQP